MELKTFGTVTKLDYQFWRALLDKGLAERKKTYKGGKQSKLGITIPGEFLVFRQKPQVFPGTNANFPGVL